MMEWWNGKMALGQMPSLFQCANIPFGLPVRSRIGSPNSRNDQHEALRRPAKAGQDVQAKANKTSTSFLAF